MIQNKSSAPPQTMTWSKASPVLVVAVIVDLARAFFEMFWFFGPAIAAMGCTGVVNNFIGTSVASVVGKVVAVTCTGAAGAAGFFGSEVTIVFGTIMAIAVGLMGFIVLGILILTTNARLFRVNMTGSLWFLGGLAISEIPFIGTFPAFSVILWKLYRKQIKIEGTALKKYQAEQAALIQQEREQSIAEFVRTREESFEILETQEAANDSFFEEDGQSMGYVRKAA